MTITKAFFTRGPFSFSARYKMQNHQELLNTVYAQAKAMGANDTQAHLAASQASLETGCGKHVAGNNYFGIKSGSSYSGPSVNTGAHEIINAQSVGLNDNVCAYGGLEDSIKGYMDFMAKKFLASWNSQNISEAAQNLTNGKFGAYATDPKYASKIQSIASAGRPAAVSRGEYDAIMNVMNRPDPTPQNPYDVY